ncbi:MAG: flagellin, partial [Planctomycetota bacterium]
QSTNFQGIKLLNGNFDYQTSGVSAALADFRINAAKFSGDSLDVDVVVTQSAQQGQLFLSLGGSTLDFGGADSGAITFEVTGSEGSRELSFESGTSLTDIVNAINSFEDVTGVTASAASGATGITLSSTNFGSDEFVSVDVNNEAGITAASAQTGLYGFDAGSVDTTRIAAFNSTAADNGVRDAGQDVNATVNGIQATARGKTLTINTDFLDTEITLTTGAAQTLATSNAFTITGGGADFQLSGEVSIAGRVTLGIQNTSTRLLGNSDVGFLDDLGSGKTFNVVNGDLEDAQKIVSEAISQVSSTRGRLGAFQTNVVASTQRSLSISFENTSAAESIIRDADFAEETASLTRSQILTQASTQILTLANQTPQSALSLLG